MRRLTKTEQLVMSAYNKDPDCVNQEDKLLEAVWLAQGWDNSKSLYWNLQRSVHPESLSRARRKLFEQGHIKYSKDAENARYEAYKAETERHSNYGDRVAQIVRPRVELVNGEWVTTL